MSTVEYTVVLEPNEGEPGYTVTVPALAGCISTGATIEEATDNVKDAIQLWIEMARKKGESLPIDFTVVSKVVMEV